MMSLLKSGNVLTKVSLVFLVVLLSAGIAYVSVFNVLPDRFFIPAATLGLFATLLVFHKYQWGIFLAFTLSIFMAWFKRMTYSEFPLGIVYDGLIVLSFLSLLISTHRQKLDWRMFSNWITYAYLMMTVFYLLEVINPEGSFTAWLVSLRFHVFFLLYIVFFHLLSSFRMLKKVTLFWIGLALVVALYGHYQEIFGFTDFEWDFIYETPERYGLYFIWGKMRTFSLLADPSAYGIFMGFGALSCLVLTLALSNWTHKILFGFLSLIMLIAMVNSGTRTGYAMVVLGLFFYVFMTLRSRKTIIVAAILLMGGLVVFFGPFHGWQLNRIRSTFTPSDDASMNVREEKRLRF